MGAGEDSQGTCHLESVLSIAESLYGKLHPGRVKVTPFRVAHNAHVTCVQFSLTGQLGIATLEDIQIWNLDRRQSGTCRSPGLVMAYPPSAGDRLIL